VVWKLDRLGRSVKNLIDLVGELQRQGVQFQSLRDSINTGTPSGRFFFHVMASLRKWSANSSLSEPARASKPPASWVARAAANAV
jgi:DNA invertase Pin-like site-specific DNA recombinase